METTLAQVACERFGMDIAMVAIRHGDTATSPYSTGTYVEVDDYGGWRNSTNLRRFGECKSAELARIFYNASLMIPVSGDACVTGPSSAVTFAEIARLAPKP